MPAIDLRVLSYAINPPHQPWPLWQAMLDRSVYAMIFCECESGVPFALAFLRPDAEWPEDPGSTVRNVYDMPHNFAEAILTASEYPRHIEMLTSGKPVFAHLDSNYPQTNHLFINDTPVAPRVGFQPMPNLDAWLTANSQVSQTIKWGDTSSPYPAWSQTQKTDLLSAFQSVWNGSPMQLPDPPQPIGSGPGDVAAVVISADDAWDLYIAHIAFMLAVELGHWVPWTVLDYGLAWPDDRISYLFEHWPICGVPDGAGGYSISGTLPAPPHVAYGFLASHSLIGADRVQTIARVLGWCRGNLTHFTGERACANDLAHWQYPIPAASRILSGTCCSTSPEQGVQHFTAGCSGTTEFLGALLRIVNIPVCYANVDAHSTAHFLSEGLYLSHGDDPYDRRSHATPELPPEELLITQSVYDSWFANEPDTATKCANVSRRVSELTIKYLPDLLLHARYLDQEAGIGISTDSAVYKLFTSNWPVFGTLCPYDLDTLASGTVTMADGSQIQCNLWGRIDEKIASFGAALTKPRPPKPSTPPIPI